MFHQCERSVTVNIDSSTVEMVNHSPVEYVKPSAADL